MLPNAAAVLAGWVLLGGAALAEPAAEAPVRAVLNGVVVQPAELIWPMLGGEVVTVTATAPAALSGLRFDGRPLAPERGRWEVVVPDTPGGHYPLTIEAGGAVQTANVMVMWPARTVRNGHLNGFRVDAYPSLPLRGLAIYRPPRGFIEVTEANRGMKVSPSYRLGEFVSKQQGGFPKYLVLEPRLLMKLELIGSGLRAAGHPVEKFTIMSGYRTPYYNRAIGNVDYSRHVWGGAADIFVDERPRDGVMDDLNRDGRLTDADAVWLFEFIDGLSRAGHFGTSRGGLGLYGANAAHGPFVHVDVRGTVARW